MGMFTSSSKSTSQLLPWQPAAGPMNSYMNQLSSLPQMEAYGGPYAAQMNPMMQQALQGQFDFGAPGGAGAQYANQMNNTGNQLMGQGMDGYQNMLSAMSNRGAPQFQFDQGTSNQIMNNYMPGLQSSATLQGLMGQRQLQSNLGQLTAAAGQAGGFGSNPLSKLAGGAASATALNNEGVQRNIQNMYMGAMGSANQAGMNAGSQNLANTMANQNSLLGGYGNMFNAGNSMMGAGYNAGRNNLNMQQNAGGLQQNYNQFVTDSQRKQFMDQQTIPMQDIMSRLNAFSGLASTFGKNKNTQSSTPSLWNQGMAIGSAAMNLSGMMPSFGAGGAGGGVPLGGGFNANLGAGGLGGTTYGQQFAVPQLPPGLGV